MNINPVRETILKMNETVKRIQDFLEKIPVVIEHEFPTGINADLCKDMKRGMLGDINRQIEEQQQILGKQITEFMQNPFSEPMPDSNMPYGSPVQDRRLETLR